jgi:hypothetical protein
MPCYPRASTASISALVGIDGAVPARVTDIDAVAVANLRAASGAMPSASPRQDRR